GPAHLAEICHALEPERLVLSLDLRDGNALVADGTGWEVSAPFALAGLAVRLGVRRILLLDLARVGTSRGIGTLPLLARLRQEFPELELTVGGGIGGSEELLAIANAGASAVLVGSALHDGRIGAAELAWISTGR